MEELRWGFSTLLAWRKGKVETIPSFILPSYHFHFPPGKQCREAPPYFPSIKTTTSSITVSAEPELSETHTGTRLDSLAW